jgi:hypothetical protein
LQEEIAGKTAQLKALWGQYQAHKAEGSDLQVRVAGKQATSSAVHSVSIHA